MKTITYQWLTNNSTWNSLIDVIKSDMIKKYWKITFITSKIQDPVVISYDITTKQYTYSIIHWNTTIKKGSIKNLTSLKYELIDVLLSQYPQFSINTSTTNLILKELQFSYWWYEFNQIYKIPLLTKCELVWSIEWRYLSIDTIINTYMSKKYKQITLLNNSWKWYSELHLQTYDGKQYNHNLSYKVIGPVYEDTLTGDIYIQYEWHIGYKQIQYLIVKDDCLITLESTTNKILEIYRFLDTLN